MPSDPHFHMSLIFNINVLSVFACLTFNRFATRSHDCGTLALFKKLCVCAFNFRLFH